MAHRPPGGGFAGRPFRPAIRVALRQLCCRGRVLAAMEAEVQGVCPAPYRAGLASPSPTQLLTALASPPCSCPHWLSPPGEVGDPEALFLRASPRYTGDRQPGETAHSARTAGTATARAHRPRARVARRPVTGPLPACARRAHPRLRRGRLTHPTATAPTAQPRAARTRRAPRPSRRDGTRASRAAAARRAANLGASTAGQRPTPAASRLGSSVVRGESGCACVLAPHGYSWRIPYGKLEHLAGRVRTARERSVGARHSLLAHCSGIRQSIPTRLPHLKCHRSDYARTPMSANSGTFRAYRGPPTPVPRHRSQATWRSDMPKPPTLRFRGVRPAPILVHHP